MTKLPPNKALQATPGVALVAVQPLIPGAPELTSEVIRRSDTNFSRVQCYTKI